MPTKHGPQELPLDPYRCMPVLAAHLSSNDYRQHCTRTLHESELIFLNSHSQRVMK